MGIKQDSIHLAEDTKNLDVVVYKLMNRPVLKIRTSTLLY
jgi:hypothetical protein